MNQKVVKKMEKLEKMEEKKLKICLVTLIITSKSNLNAFIFLINKFSFNEEEQINNIFQPPQFDISNFREYYPEHEYETMIKDFDEYTKGNTPLSKKNFVKRKLLGHKIKIDAKQKIKENLKDLFKTRTDDELQTDRPSELIGHYSNYLILTLILYSS